MCMTGAGATVQFGTDDVVPLASIAGFPQTIEGIECPALLGDTAAVYRQKEPSGVIDHDEVDCTLHFDPQDIVKWQTHFQGRAKQTLTVTFGLYDSANAVAGTLTGEAFISGFNLAEVEAETPTLFNVVFSFTGLSTAKPTYTDEAAA